MIDPMFFGYGSLVNRATHAYPDLRPARLAGWRRVWRHTDISETAFLTAVPHADTTIDGVLARVPGGDWAALDLRETGYERVAVRIDAADAAVYSIAEGRHGAPETPRHILLSYLDAVIQGFLREFGAEGVARFFATTDGWDAPVLDDRGAPRYPRHQTLNDDERALVDRGLAGVGVRPVPA
ncbi:gamma-glutamylcyclotransferase family protein [Oceaniglobus trochenteri]|uniref:gamma-glutamylcyclotransferase family protein n=1 Tax=Oceaniglobus trochenteri TaxID=2763260 RepID=UPI001CFF65EC|nr:gamma-glutamylcyclotransferase family protein [Oceaniglobus trochenteri]